MSIWIKPMSLPLLNQLNAQTAAAQRVPLIRDETGQMLVGSALIRRFSINWIWRWSCCGPSPGAYSSCTASMICLME